MLELLLDENSAAEYYKYTKLDLENEKDFNLIKDYFTFKDDDIDKKVVEGEKLVHYKYYA